MEVLVLSQLDSFQLNAEKQNKATRACQGCNSVPAGIGERGSDKLCIGDTDHSFESLTCICSFNPAMIFGLITPRK